MTRLQPLTGSNQAHGAEEDGGRSEPGGEGGDAEAGPRRPFVVEFAGTPRAGKTTTLGGLKRLLEDRRGLRVEVVDEQARCCPVPDKVNPDFNRWTFSRTLTGIVEARYSGADVVLVDRGLFDGRTWMEWFRCHGKLAADRHEATDQYLRTEARSLIDLVIVMTVEPREALKREQTGGPRRTPGPIINRTTLFTLNEAIEVVTTSSFPDVSLERLDTTHTDAAETLVRVSEALDRRLPARLREKTSPNGKAALQILTHC